MCPLLCLFAVCPALFLDDQSSSYFMQFQTIYISITVFNTYSMQFTAIYMDITYLHPSSDALFHFQ